MGTHPGVVGTSPSRRRVEEWALVLEAEGVACTVSFVDGGWVVEVPPGVADAAREAVAAYERERSTRRPAVVPPRDHGPSLAGVVAGAVVSVVHRLAGPRAGASRWFEVGSLTPAALGGEPWRAVTALTLHADTTHLVGNLASGAILLTLLCRAVGPGLGVWLALAAGTGGNLLSVAVHGPGYSAVGASTAILGIVGLLAGLATVTPGRARGAWVPIAAGLALLAALGAGEGTDLVAHAAGFAVGLPLGIAAGQLRAAEPRGATSVLLAGLALVPVWAAWALAFARGR